MKLIVGLGNPETKYNNTRHNYGFLVLDKLANNWSDKKQLHCQISKIDNAILCRPLTYMNNSGQAVKAVASYYKVTIDEIIVIHDDLDLPLGQIKTGVFSSSAGHNGIKSIQEVVGKDFIRIRLGIGRPTNNQQDIPDYVLEKFSSAELKIIKPAIQTAVDIAKCLTQQPLIEVQNKYN